MVMAEASEEKLNDGEMNRGKPCTALNQWREKQEERHLKLELARPKQNEEELINRETDGNKKKARLSDDGARILNKMSKESNHPPLISKRNVTKARKLLESVIKYDVYENSSFRMQNVRSFLEERMRHANIEDKNLVWYLDKGRGRVVSTFGLVGTSTTQSHYNQTIVQTWEGSDHPGPTKE
ncbi:unnamed protein product [Bursaphelenchus okinawaensis]|uniref:Uncharacterized protein n=1 Tax=Bursaphelenchus okinawaensis TaxID=465554 RepID=A0A811KC49_9BILA|nr:unnamed protein product [Bursaphelenchus okinawaensis]CAG9097661.1 unnamed protein product [Bursaphelenchus okinawaensis]